MIFRSKLGSLRKSFKKDIEFVFINAPHEVPPDEAGEENAGKIYVHMLGKKILELKRLVLYRLIGICTMILEALTMVSTCII